MILKTATSGTKCCYNHMDAVLDDSKKKWLAGASWHGLFESATWGWQFKRSYIGMRLNTKMDPTLDPTQSWQALIEAFPGDGEYKLIRRSSEVCLYRYTEGPKDRAWMEQQDISYLKGLLASGTPEDRELFEIAMRHLDTDLVHHQKLKTIFEPHTRAYLSTYITHEVKHAQQRSYEMIDGMLKVMETSIAALTKRHATQAKSFEDLYPSIPSSELRDQPEMHRRVSDWVAESRRLTQRMREHRETLMTRLGDVEERLHQLAGTGKPDREARSESTEPGMRP